MMNLTGEGTRDKSDVLRWDPFNCFLYDMITVLILDALDDFSIKFFDKRGLLIDEDDIERLYIYVSLSSTDSRGNTDLLNNPTCIHLH